MKKGDNVLIHAVSFGLAYVSYELIPRVHQESESRLSSLLVCLSTTIYKMCLYQVNVTGADKVFTTCGTDEKVSFLKKLVNNDERLHVINYKTQSQFSLSA